MKNLNRYKGIVIGLLLLSSCTKGIAQPPAAPFRIVGYFKGDLKTESELIDFKKITHLNVAFINPDSNGVFQVVPGLSALVARAHDNHVKILAAIGGGKAPKYFPALLKANKRAEFSLSIKNLMDNYSLDGIDIDIEGELITEDYEGFITGLASVIKPQGLLTVAVASNNARFFTENVVKAFDFINIMSYDKTGPWRPKDAGPHAPYEMFAEDLSFWKAKGATQAQLNAGLPFYGYAFNSATISMSYKKLIETYPGAENEDELKLPDGGMLYYNGLLTIKKKTQLALKEAGGVMIWQLVQDSKDKNSLLNAIYKTVKAQ